MKVFMYGDTVINLAEVIYIKAFRATRKNENGSIRFYLKGGEPYGESISVPNEEITKLLQICYEEMTKKEE